MASTFFSGGLSCWESVFRRACFFFLGSVVGVPNAATLNFQGAWQGPCSGFLCRCFMRLLTWIRWEGRLGRWLRRATGVAWASRGWSAPVCAVCYVSRDRCSELRHAEARTMAAVKLCQQGPCPRATLRIRLI